MYVLVCNRVNISDATAAFNKARNTYSFFNANKVIPDSKSVVICYTIITDGHDVLAHVGPTGAIDIGMPVLITHEGSFLSRIFRNKTKFDKITKDCATESFFNVFKEAYASRNVKGAVERELLGSQDVKFYSTGKAVPTLDGLQVYPIYFLHLRSICPIIFPPNNGEISYAVVSLNLLKTDSGILQSMPYVSRMVTQMLAHNIIEAPNHREGCFNTDT